MDKQPGEKASEVGGNIRNMLRELYCARDKWGNTVAVDKFGKITSPYSDEKIDLTKTLRAMKDHIKDWTPEERDEWLLSMFSRDAYEALIILLDDLD